MSSFAQLGKTSTARPKISLPLLRRLRLLCTVLALVSGGLLPFDLGVLTAPRLSSLPLVGGLFPRLIGVLTISNAPYTAVVGHTERFSVQLENQPHTPLVYELYYPDGRVVRADETSDANGFSSHTFRIEGYQLTQFREEATVGVRGVTGSYRAYLHFAIQQDRPAPSSIVALSGDGEKAKLLPQYYKSAHAQRVEQRVRAAGPLRAQRLVS